MQITANARVIGSDGHDLGHVRRVVIDPTNNEVLDIVVRQGTLVTQDRVVPLADVAGSDGEHVHLRIDAKAVESLEPFEEEYYLPASDTAADLPAGALPPASYWYPPTLGFTPPGLAAASTPELYGYQLRRQRHIPDNTVALKEGAAVVAKDGHGVGKLEQVITAPSSDQATHIVVADGLVNKTRKVVPLDWVEKINEKSVTLAVSSSLIEQLPVYEPAQ